jgi:hypothetical protein
MATPRMVFDKDRYDNFLAAAKGLTALQTARVMSTWGTLGVNWCGTGKREMAEAYSYGAGFECQISEKVIGKLFLESRERRGT